MSREARAPTLLARAQGSHGRAVGGGRLAGAQGWPAQDRHVVSDGRRGRREGPFVLSCVPDDPALHQLLWLMRQVSAEQEIAVLAIILC